MLDTASRMDPPQGTAEHLTQDGGKGKKIVAREWRRKQKERSIHQGQRMEEEEEKEVLHGRAEILLQPTEALCWSMP